MQGLEIRSTDARRVLEFDLRELLACLDAEIDAREWTCRWVDAPGASYQYFDRWSASGEWRPSSRLIEAARGIDQAVDGDFYGRRTGEATPSLIIKAVDSSYWEVFGDRLCLDLVRAHFGNFRLVESIADDGLIALV